MVPYSLNSAPPKRRTPGLRRIGRGILCQNRGARICDSIEHQWDCNLPGSRKYDPRQKIHASQVQRQLRIEDLIQTISIETHQFLGGGVLSHELFEIQISFLSIRGRVADHRVEIASAVLTVGGWQVDQVGSVFAKLGIRSEISAMST